MTSNPTLDALFGLANALALLGWVALLAAPWASRLAQAVAGLAVPLVLSAGYAALALVHLVAATTSGEGGFGSLADVAALFADPAVLLLGWVHYLAFDLLIGALIVREARAAGAPFLLALPCLPLTFLAGPAGWLLWRALLAIRGTVRSPSSRET